MRASSRMILSALAVSAAAGNAWAQDSFTVRATVWDFKRFHKDFGHATGATLTPTAGLVQAELSPDGFLVYTANGAEVLSPAMDKNGVPVAMHLARVDEVAEDTGSAVSGGPYVLESAPSIANDPTIDSWDPELGPYGGSNVGPAPECELVAEVPESSPPSGIPLEADWDFSGKGTTYIDRDVHVRNFTSKNQRTFVVQGERTVRVDTSFEMDNKCTWVLDPGATLTLWIGGSFELDNHCDFNANTGDHTLVTVRNFGSQQMDIGNNSSLYATVVAPDAGLRLHNSGELWGAVALESLSMSNGGSGLHLAGTGSSEPPPAPVCFAAADTDGATGALSTAGVGSFSSFSQWFRDVPVINMSMFKRIAFLQTDPGVYVFDAPAYDPINGELFGNEGMANNGNFTLRVDGEFYFEPCGGQYMDITADCDVWVFVDGKLAVDMGGNAPGDRQRIDIERFDLEDGGQYKLTLFMATRTGAAPDIRVETNLVMFSTYDVATPVSYMGD